MRARQSRGHRSPRLSLRREQSTRAALDYTVSNLAGDNGYVMTRRLDWRRHRSYGLGTEILSPMIVRMRRMEAILNG
jgi:hypothetical protein